MKTKVIAFIAATVLTLSMTACSESSTDNSAELESLKAVNESLQAENEELQEQIDALTFLGILDNTETEPDQTDVEATPITLNSTVAVGEISEFTLTGSEWTEEISPSNTDDYYSYYEDEEGAKYFVVRGTFKNLSGIEHQLTYAGEVKLVINDKFNIPARMELEDKDGTGFFGTAKSLQTLNMIIYASVSDEVYDACEKVQVNLELMNQEEDLEYFYYAEDHSHDKFTITFENTK